MAELGGFGVSALSEDDYQAWLTGKGLNVPFYTRYLDWVGNVFVGDFGHSFEKNEKVSVIIGEKLINTAILGFWVFAPDDPAVPRDGGRRRHEGGGPSATGRSRWSRSSPPRSPRSRRRSS